MSRHWDGVAWHEPANWTTTSRDYDIYIVADVDALKRDHAELRARYAEVVHENAELHMLLDRRRRAAAYEEKDYGWMGD